MKNFIKIQRRTLSKHQDTDLSKRDVWEIHKLKIVA
ncbi:MAG: hypothetical protein QG670_2042 [Thermoproteota archaeon]|nr:hypothetical protein [Thermoproteota archaeon]